MVPSFRLPLLISAALICGLASGGVAAPVMAQTPQEAAGGEAKEPKAERKAVTEGYRDAWIAGADEDAATVSIQLENDRFGVTDRHYTHGTRMTWLSAPRDVPEWSRKVGSGSQVLDADAISRWGVEIGQSIFTPQDTSRNDPDPADRPYAAWTYVGLGYIAESGARMDRLALNLGVVGPAAMGEEVQNTFHRIIGVSTAEGWDHQLHNEPGAVLLYERKWRDAWKADLGALTVDVAPHVGGALGNVYTYGAAGATLRLGFGDPPKDFGPPRIRPSLPGSTWFPKADGLDGYLFAGVEGRAIARNIFLDGNTFGDSPDVEKIPLVGDLQAGLVLSWDDLRLTYTQIIRSPEFVGQDGPDVYGSVSVSYRY